MGVDVSHVSLYDCTNSGGSNVCILCRLVIEHLVKRENLEKKNGFQLFFLSFFINNNGPFSEKAPVIFKLVFFINK